MNLKEYYPINKLDFADSGILVEDIVELLEMLQNKEITTKAGQRIIEHMPNNKQTPKQ